MGTERQASGRKDRTDHHHGHETGLTAKGEQAERVNAVGNSKGQLRELGGHRWRNWVTAAAVGEVCSQPPAVPAV